MGQQQLLLLVLGAIIVGTAILVGINMFSTSAVQSNQDSCTQDVLTLASRFQENWRKPPALGGAGQDWTGAVFTDIGIDASMFDADGSGTAAVATPTLWENANGAYIIKTATARLIEIEVETREANAGGQIYFITYSITPNQCEVKTGSTWTARTSVVPAS